MTIDPLSSRRLNPPGRGPRVRSGDAVGNFSDSLVTSTSDTAPTATATGPVALDALLSLQEMPTDLGDRASARRRGEDLLDALEELRLGLLRGGVSRETLSRLMQLASEQAAQSDDPRLSEVLQEIELRAAVELAKLGH